jgi:transglutaminase-like putative cysteine protease
MVQKECSRSRFCIKPYLKFIVPIVIIILLVSVMALPDLIKTCDKDEALSVRYRSTEEFIAVEKSGRITFNVTIDTIAGDNVTRLWLPYPMSNEYQIIEDVTVDGNFNSSGVHRDSGSGSIMLYAEWADPAEKPHLIYSFNVTRIEINRKDFPLTVSGPIPPEVEKYLNPTSRGAPEEVKELAKNVSKCGNTILTKAVAIYDYIVDNGQRDPTIHGCGDGEVCDLIDLNLSGKCVDIHSIFVALARSMGIPAREIMGTRIGGEGDITGAYHCRAEFYLPGYGWIPVDPSDVRKAILVEGLNMSDERTEEVRDYFFGRQTETYIDFYSGRDIDLNPSQSGEPLNYFMYPHAEVDGVALDHLSQEKLQYQVTFAES